MTVSPYTPRRSAGLAAYENALARAGLAPVAGIDEAGRGACAGPLVVAAVVLDATAIKRIRGLADSKLLSPGARETAYDSIVARAVDWHVTVISHTEIDRLGLHVCNVEGMRRAFAGLTRRAAYVLTDGFPVSGLGAPALAMWKGDRVAASVAAASIVAKVTRDRMMQQLDERYPEYGFGRHKGYVTEEHLAALARYGACPVHRRSFRCVPGGRPGQKGPGQEGPGQDWPGQEGPGPGEPGQDRTGPGGPAGLDGPDGPGRPGADGLGSGLDGAGMGVSGMAVPATA